MHHLDCADLEALLVRGPRDNDADGRPCDACGGRGARWTIEPEHAPGCYGDCHRHGCPMPVAVQVPCDTCRHTGTVYDKEYL